MKYLTLLILLVFCGSTMAQRNVKMAGDTTDAKFMESVKKLEAQGWNVEIVSEAEIKNEDPDKKPISEIHEGGKLPDFSYTTLDGQQLTLDDLKDKVVHINFWSVTCKPCIEEFPELNKLKEKYNSENTVFLAIAPEPEDKVNRILKKHALEYTIIAGADDYFKRLGIHGYPVNFFVNQDGIIEHVLEGSRYKGVMVNGKMEMRPDNYGTYNRILRKLN